MTRKTRPFSELRQEQLLIPEVASEYLNLAKVQSQEIFLKALRRVAQARQMSTVAREAGVQRETLYHALSEAGNPTIDTFASVLSALGLDYDVRPKKRIKAKRAILESSEGSEIFPSQPKSVSKTIENLSTGFTNGTSSLWQSCSGTYLMTDSLSRGFMPIIRPQVLASSLYQDKQENVSRAA